MNKVYISGPITGHDLDERRQTFANAAKAAEAELNCVAVNPMDIGVPGCEYMCDPGQLADQPPYMHTWNCWMKHDIKALLECDAILMLPGWAESRGATLEYQVADALGYKIVHMDSLGCTDVP